MMKEKILQEIKAIEEQEKVKILLAVESGSRAWGFESPDSDYDVRFIYSRQTADYLKLQAQPDVIDWVLNDVLDINGWDLQKALRLLYKSNPTLIEWTKSPIVYYEAPECQGLKDLLEDYFSAKKSLYHYLNMAKTNYEKHLTGERIKVKKYFYALRPILAANWIVKRQTPPPIEFDKLVEAELPRNLMPVVQDLLERKQVLPEGGIIDRVEVVNAYLEDQMVRLNQLAAELPVEKVDWQKLNHYFLEVLGQDATR
ncbi:nucleotidyltransferase domain-containing protein [Streptococcus henryi]|uniref:nucleotidyltransferase domain-containing protein n=1 Tax=Streptococcus henryi TaxID=439219 RepID=UPI00037E5A21|nr:nucleotidyltransferase domain-containing protein [Streptococcus henryi]